jgi:hypothetical protein
MIPPPPLRQKLPTLSADVEQVVLTALAKDPAQRFKSVTAFACALEQASNGTAQRKALSGRTALQPHQVSSFLSEGVRQKPLSQVQTASPAPQPALQEAPSLPQQKPIDSSARENQPVQPRGTPARSLRSIFLMLLYSIGGSTFVGFIVDQFAGAHGGITVIGFWIGIVLGVVILPLLDLFTPRPSR